jgi:hypothetical protein
MRRAFEINPDLEDTHTHLKRMVRSIPSDQRKVTAISPAQCR